MPCRPCEVRTSLPPGRITRRISRSQSMAAPSAKWDQIEIGEDEVERVVRVGERRPLGAVLEVECPGGWPAPSRSPARSDRSRATPSPGRRRRSTRTTRPGRAAEVEARLAGAELEAGLSDGRDDHVRVVRGPAGRLRRCAPSRGSRAAGVALRSPVASRTERHLVVHAERERQAAPRQRVGGVPDAALRRRQAGFDLGDRGVREALVEQIRHGRCVGPVRGDGPGEGIPFAGLRKRLARPQRPAEPREPAAGAP